jgi:hypothetical protein
MGWWDGLLQALPALASAAGTIAQSRGAKDAANASVAGTNAGIAEQRRQFDLIMQMLRPQQQLGNNAINTLSRLYGYAPNMQTGAGPAGLGAIGASANGSGSIGSTGIGVSPNGGITQGVSSAATGRYANMAPQQILESLYGPDGFTQEGVNALYAARGLANPPQVPAGLVGHRPGGGRARSMLTGPNGQRLRTQEDADFLNAFGTQVVDPYRQQSGISQVAGGVLDVASAAIPSFGLFRAGADLGNALIDKPGGGDATYLPDGGAGTEGGFANNPSVQGPADMSVFTSSPDYQFRRDEGNRDINNSFAARGGALSGNALRGITDFNSNLASGEFNNFVQRQLQMAGLGGAATSQATNAAQYTGGNVSNLLQAGGNARASGIADRTNAITGGINDLATWYGDWMKRRNGGGEGVWV